MKRMKNLLLILFLFSSKIFAQPDNYVVDALVHPKIPARIVTVGGNDADIQGFTNEAIQLAVDALPAEGGTVKMQAGEFTMKAPVLMKSNVRLTGSGPQTVLKRIAGYRSPFIIDADYNELKITVEDPSGFEPGMSFQVNNDP